MACIVGVFAGSAGAGPQAESWLMASARVASATRRTSPTPPRILYRNFMIAPPGERDHRMPRGPVPDPASVGQHALRRPARIARPFRSVLLNRGDGAVEQHQQGARRALPG